MSVEVKIIADSRSPLGDRITTFQLRYWRAIHPDFLMHPDFSRNASSSRALSGEQLIDEVLAHPAMPIWWGAAEPGALAHGEVAHWTREEAIHVWDQARLAAIEHARKLLALGLHGQLVNRVLEPYSWVDVVMTTTRIENFFDLRAQAVQIPEIQELAKGMKVALRASHPVELAFGDWHLPYVQVPERRLALDVQLKLSTVRCARGSYLVEDRDPKRADELDRYERLVDPATHLSDIDRPDEHQAVALPPNRWQYLQGNFTAFGQYRKHLEYHIDPLDPPYAALRGTGRGPNATGALRVD